MSWKFGHMAEYPADPRQLGSMNPEMDADVFKAGPPAKEPVVDLELPSFLRRSSQVLKGASTTVTPQGAGIAQPTMEHMASMFGDRMRTALQHHTAPLGHPHGCLPAYGQPSGVGGHPHGYPPAFGHHAYGFAHVQPGMNAAMPAEFQQATSARSASDLGEALPKPKMAKTCV